MTKLLQMIVTSIASGATYGLLALGYNLIYSTMNMAHFAQADVMMLSGFFCLTFQGTGLPFPLCIFFSIIATILIMFLVERLAYRPMYNASSTFLIIATMGVATVLRSGAQLAFGTQTHGFPNIFSNKPFYFGEVALVPQNLWILGITLALMLGLFAFMKYTKIGTAMRAISMNRTAASLMGIRMTTVTMVAYGIAAGLAAIAGVLMSPIFKVHAYVGQNLGSKAMTASVIGGMGDARASLVGGLLLGLVDTAVSVYISTAYKDVFSFIVLLLVVMLLPQGILGKRKVTKV